MKTYETPEWIAEQSYKNGYAKGYEDGVREFAERLKKKFTLPWCGSKYGIIHNWIKDTAEEMVGEKDA